MQDNVDLPCSHSLNEWGSAIEPEPGRKARGGGIKYTSFIIHFFFFFYNRFFLFMSSKSIRIPYLYRYLHTYMRVFQ